jgi:hypothetical protein
MTLCSDWTTAAAVGNCGCRDVPNPTVLADSISQASELLYVLSGRQFPGLCEWILRPCGSHCNCEYDLCGCNRLPRVFLGYDVLAVASVDVGGVLLEVDTYRLENGWLVRLDGGLWPCCQNMAGEPGDEDTFSVTVTTGTEPPASGIAAAKALTAELVKACTDGEVCALPTRVTSLVRQGVSMVLLDPMEFLDSGRTGVYAIDLFLAAYNPNGMKRPASAWSPDLPVTQRYPVPTS